MSKSNKEAEPVFSIREIRELLPHRYPFLLVDRVLECKKGEYLKALKNVSINEPFFNGHFPESPVMPGVLIIEALAQVTGLLAFKTAEQSLKDGDLPFLVGIDSARFKRVVLPGDQLILTVTLIKERQNIWKFKGIATVDQEEVCTAELMSAIRPLQE